MLGRDTQRASVERVQRAGLEIDGQSLQRGDRGGELAIHRCRERARRLLKPLLRLSPLLGGEEPDHRSGEHEDGQERGEHQQHQMRPHFHADESIVRKGQDTNLLDELDALRAGQAIGSAVRRDFKILPVALFGRRSSTTTRRGYLNAASRSRHQATRSSELARVPRRSTTKAATSSPSSGWGSATTAASATAGWAQSAVSTSRGKIE